MNFEGMTPREAAQLIVVAYADGSPADCDKLTAAINAACEHFRAQPQPGPKTCLTCRHLDEPESRHKWHRCNFRPVLPSCITSWSERAIDITSPLANCPTWEARSKQGEVGK